MKAAAVKPRRAAAPADAPPTRLGRSRSQASAPPGAGGARRIGILGGTFDPIHRGHLALAAAAERRCRLEWVYFVPADNPGHKAAPVAGFADRYAMTALALAGRRRWSPLAIPAPPGQPTHSLRQVRWIARRHPRARLFFLLGADAMVELPTWHRYRDLLAACDFIVAPRLGFGPPAVAAALPPGLVRPDQRGDWRLGRRRVFWLANFREPAGSRQLRAGLRREVEAGRGPAPVNVRNRSRQPAAIPAAVAAYLRRGGFYNR